MVWRIRLPPVKIQCYRTIRTQARYDYVNRDDEILTIPRPAALATPRQLVQYLDDYIVGQKNAKKILSVAVYNHYNRVRANTSYLNEEDRLAGWSDQSSNESLPAVQLQPHPYRLPGQGPNGSLSLASQPPFEKSNVLLIGPTGSGKTLLAKTLARVLDVPFSISDATSFTQAGYVGEDVEMCVHRLLQAANWDSQRARSSQITGIIYIDEVDKLARKNSGIEGSRDVGGEGVQQALLRMMEGSVVTIQAKAVNNEGPVNHDGRPKAGARSSGPKHDTYQIDTSNILFILSGAFVGLENILKQRIEKGSIGFAANLNQLSDELPAQGFVPFFTPNKGASNLLEMVEPADLVKFGFIPEFISRLPIISSLAPLTTADMLRILTEVRGSLVSQYAALFGHSNVEIRFTRAALKEICSQALKRGGGARGLRGIMEITLLDAMYEVPGSSIRYVLITAPVVKRLQPALYWSRGEGTAFWTAWAQEESLEESTGLP